MRDRNTPSDIFVFRVYSQIEIFAYRLEHRNDPVEIKITNEWVEIKG
tara:strand:+ start:837 stop:977 length:141 start_codon:yes stop_codon:yes gene_type:complete